MNKRSISIPLPPYFSFEECLWYLDRNYNDCMHSVKGSELRKAIIITDQPILLAITQSNKALIIHVLQGKTDSSSFAAIIQYVTGWLDINRDLKPFYALLEKDKKLSYMAEEFKGLRLIGIPDLFETICWCIIGQQINLAFAHKVKRRLVETYGNGIEYEDSIYYTFPTPEDLLNVSMEALKAMQFSSMKANYIVSTAKAFSDGIISMQKLQQIAGFNLKQKALINLKGVGIWTANYALMKTLRESGAIPYGDAGLLNALINHGIIKEKKDMPAIEKFFRKFPGWESYMAFYLWRSLSRRQ